MQACLTGSTPPITSAAAFSTQVIAVHLGNSASKVCQTPQVSRAVSKRPRSFPAAGISMSLLRVGFMYQPPEAVHLPPSHTLLWPRQKVLRRWPRIANTWLRVLKMVASTRVPMAGRTGLN